MPRHTLAPQAGAEGGGSSVCPRRPTIGVTNHVPSLGPRLMRWRRQGRERERGREGEREREMEGRRESERERERGEERDTRRNLDQFRTKKPPGLV